MELKAKLISENSKLYTSVVLPKILEYLEF